MTKRCLLHLGMPKTASTSIQVALSDNRTLLKKKGWEYPIFKCPQHGNSFYFHNEPLCRLFYPMHPFHVQRDVKNGNIDLEIQKNGILDQLNAYCQSSSKLILSSEALLRPAPLARIKNYLSSRGYEIEPVIYVRAPLSYRVSIYQSLLKFSQLTGPVIVKSLQTPLVRSSVEAALKHFGDRVKFYPFNHLGRSGVDVVQHFFAHFLDERACQNLILRKENRSLSWHATSLLEYIEDRSPLYINDIRNSERMPGDIRPLHELAGEKFRFSPRQLSFFNQVIDMENKWLEKILGKEFCDGNFGGQVASEPLEWEETSGYSLLKIFPKVPVHIQQLIMDYLHEKAVFSSPEVQKTIINDLKLEQKKNKQSSLFRLIRLFPEETKRGYFARKLYKSFKIKLSL